MEPDGESRSAPERGIDRSPAACGISRVDGFQKEKARFTLCGFGVGSERVRWSAGCCWSRAAVPSRHRVPRRRSRGSPARRVRRSRRMKEPSLLRMLARRRGEASPRRPCPETVNSRNADLSRPDGHAVRLLFCACEFSAAIRKPGAVFSRWEIASGLSPALRVVAETFPF